MHSHLVTNMSSHIDNWKRAIATIKKERDLDGRRAKTDYRKAVVEFAKFESKLKKRVSSPSDIGSRLFVEY